MKAAAFASAVMGVKPTLSADNRPGAVKSWDQLLTAYYFRAHMYTMVSRQVREDLQWMADVGTNYVAVAILEQDLRAAVENVEIIAREADRLNMKLLAVPSRWGGLLAGAPKVPSYFTITNPQTWMADDKGEFYKDRNVGAHSSIHYPETYDFFCKSLKKIFSLWDIAGVIWDEPKIYDKRDYSAEAKKNIPRLEEVELHNQAFSNFFSRLNAFIKKQFPGKITNLFVYANMRQGIIDSAASIQDLDYFGCDGRPWSANKRGKAEQEGKVLLGPGQKFMEAAKKNGKKSLFLIENHNMPVEDNDLMEARLGDVLALKPDHLMYYYYPRNVDKPDDNMAIIAKHLKSYR